MRTKRNLHNSSKYTNGTYFSSIRFPKYTDTFLYHYIMTALFKKITENLLQLFIQQLNQIYLKILTNIVCVEGGNSRDS